MGMRRTILLLASAALTVLLACGVALASPGSLDPSFDSDGKVVTDFAPLEDPRDEATQDVIVQPDGKIVAAGYAQPDQFGENGGFALARYESNGSLDASFGINGKVVTSTGGLGKVNALAIQKDGKILAGGESGNNNGGLLAQYNADGTLDTTFGTQGMVSDFSKPIYSIAVQDDGKIVVAGGMKYSDYVIARYNTNGTPDTSFDSDGKVQTAFGQAMDTYPHDLAIQADSKIVVVGATINQAGNEDFGIIRYNADGSLDSSFGEGGKLRGYMTSDNDVARTIAVQPDGKLVVGGSAGANCCIGGLARYNADGSLDTSFGTTGKVLNPPTGQISDMVIQSDNKIVVTGYETYSNPLVRYNADGSRDKSLQAQNAFLSSDPALALQEDGKLVLAGDASYPSNFALDRYMGGVDTEIPSGNVVINKGRTYTSSRTVPLKLHATDSGSASGVAMMRIKNGGTPWTRWQSYATSKDWKLTRGAGKKTVYAQYKDWAGNVSAAATDRIIYRPQ
jgi:uncharacterized delta-60 repeat protein